MSDFLPLDVTDLTGAFGALGAELQRLAPMYRSAHDVDVPPEFLHGHTLWNVVVSQWFFRGLKCGDVFTPKEGIDVQQALRHIHAVLRSFEPGHNEKEALCAYLLSLWFDDFVPSDEHEQPFLDQIARRR